MKPEPYRLRKYLLEIRKSAAELEILVRENSLKPGSVALNAAKYLLIELAEAVSNTLQHLLAREKGVAVSGYLDTLAKAREHGIVSEELFIRLKPFFDFRNSLVHRYWTIDDSKLIGNILDGRGDFIRFVEEIESHAEGPGREV